jgi:hypothetical protein
LETTLGALIYWGFQVGEGPMKIVLGVLLPLLAATVWGTFRVPNDPGKAPVAVRGPVRLLLEAAFFGLAVAALSSAGGAARYGRGDQLRHHG